GIRDRNVTGVQTCALPISGKEWNTMTVQYELVSFTEYQNFESINEMDQTVKQFNTKISKPHYETLNLLKQYSCKIIGVSHLKIETMAQTLNKSIRAIHRHIR